MVQEVISKVSDLRISRNFHEPLPLFANANLPRRGKTGWMEREKYRHPFEISAKTIN